MTLGYKTGGRTTGTPNKTTGQLKDRLTEIITKELESLPEMLAVLPAQERVHAVIKLMGYVIPKPLQKFEHEPDGVIKITMNLGDEPKPLNKLQQAIERGIN